MMDLLYAVNQEAQTVASGGVINFGDVVRLVNTGVILVGGNPVLESRGVYEILSNVTITTTAAGTVEVTLYKEGTAIPGATASVTLGEAGTVALTVPAEVRHKCCCESPITCVVSGSTAITSVTVNNAAISVKRLVA